MFFMPFQASTVFDILLRTSFISSHIKFEWKIQKEKSMFVVQICYQEKVITIIMISFSNEISQTDWKKIRRNFFFNKLVLLLGANDESKNILWNLENEWKYIVITLGIWWIADSEWWDYYIVDCCQWFSVLLFVLMNSNAIMQIRGSTLLCENKKLKIIFYPFSMKHMLYTIEIYSNTLRVTLDDRLSLWRWFSKSHF